MPLPYAVQFLHAGRSQIQDVKEAGIIHLQLGGLVAGGERDELNTGHIAPGSPVVLRVPLENPPLAAPPRRQGEWAVGHEVLRLRPCRPVTLHCPARDGVGGRKGQQMEKVSAGPFELDHECDAVEGPHAHTIWLTHQALVVRLCTLEVIEQAGIARPGGRIEHALPGILKVVGRHGCAVTPQHVIPQVKDVPPPAIEHLPVNCHIGHNAELRRMINQPTEKLPEHFSPIKIGAQPGIQGQWGTPNETARSEGMGRRR